MRKNVYQTENTYVIIGIKGQIWLTNVKNICEWFLTVHRS